MVSKGFPNVTTSGRQCNIGEKPSVILYTYINLHVGTPKPQSFLSKTRVLDYSVVIWSYTLLDVPAGVTQEEGHTGFFIYLPSAVLALIFLARRIQPFLSVVDREEVELCALTV